MRLLSPKCRPRSPGGQVIDRIEHRSRRAERVDPVESFRRKAKITPAEHALEVLHRPRTDDRCGDGRMLNDERNRQLREANTQLVCHLGQLCDEGNLAPDILSVRVERPAREAGEALNPVVGTRKVPGSAVFSGEKPAIERTIG